MPLICTRRLNQLRKVNAMNDEKIGFTEMVLFQDCEDIRALAEYQRAEYLSGQVHRLLGWVSRKVSQGAHDIGALLHRHAH